MALIELASAPLNCTKLVVCLDRMTPGGSSKSLMRDLGWVGFELITLGEWAGRKDIVSNRWIFLGMEV
jgi:hypothetical protein